MIPENKDYIQWLQDLSTHLFQQLCLIVLQKKKSQSKQANV